jgi:SAM-dependent methyltransferase
MAERVVTSSEVWDEGTAARYDRDVAEMFEAEALDRTVSFLEDRAGAGRVLEFAIGTGRIAIPLVERGRDVTGVDLSSAMVAQLRRKISEERLPAVVGDMASLSVPGDFSLVYCVFNSLSNLTTQKEQVACFQNAARHLSAGGRFVVEMWVPALRRLPPGQVAVPFEVSEDHLGFDNYDLLTQNCVSHHYWRDDDDTFRQASGTFRFVWPAEMDLMAQLAGLELEERVADWAGSPFTADSENHVSVWRK